MKHLVKTSGDFMLYDVSTKTHISNNRPHIVPVSPFIAERIGLSELVLMAQNLPNTALDEDYAVYIKESDGDIELATASFMSTFGLDENGKPIPEVKK